MRAAHLCVTGACNCFKMRTKARTGVELFVMLHDTYYTSSTPLQHVKSQHLILHIVAAKMNLIMHCRITACHVASRVLYPTVYTFSLYHMISYMCIYIYTHTYIHTYVLGVYVDMLICWYVYIYIYIYIYPLSPPATTTQTLSNRLR